MKQVLFKTFALIILASSIGLGWLWMDFNNFLDTPIVLNNEQLRIEVEEGDTMSTVIQQLQKSGRPISSYYMRFTSRLYPELTRIKRGEFLIKGPANILELLDQLSKGEVLYHQVQIIEGWTFKTISAVLLKQQLLKHQLSHITAEELMSSLGSNYKNPEGWFYPDTYNYVKHDSDLQILKVAHNTMKKVLNKYWNERDLGLPYDSPYEVLIMASIIEKETGLAEERRMISGVFVRRLLKGMRLQTDPSVIYGLGDRFDGNLTRAHLKADNPYNTYRNKGLPPTPIALASEASISAAVHPDESDTLYFVARGDGSHEFSQTNRQHNAAVRKYQLNRN